MLAHYRTGGDTVLKGTLVVCSYGSAKINRSGILRFELCEKSLSFEDINSTHSIQFEF